MKFEMGDFKIEAMDMPTAMVKLADRYNRLIRVARAAYIYDYCNDDDLERKKRLLLEMRNALRDAEHLLGFVTTGA